MPEIGEMRASDWPAVREVYADGIATGQATFEERPPSWEEWDRGHLRECRLVARRDGRVVAFAALSAVSEREAYRGVAEVSLYVAAAERGTGIGRVLGAALVEASERAGIWTLEGWVFPENRASLALCEDLGCRVVGVRERLGCMNGRWRDVVLVERRSAALQPHPARTSRITRNNRQRGTLGAQGAASSASSAPGSAVGIRQAKFRHT